MSEIPSLQDLADRRLAQILGRDQKSGRITAVSITPEGHALLGTALREKGRRQMPTREVPCPTCQTPAGADCTQPTSTGRSPVKWLHSSRISEEEGS